MSLSIRLLLVVFFLIMNGFFVVAEFACVRVRKSQIDLALEAGRMGARYAKLVSENVNAYLSACQLGITLASLALGWLGEPALSELLRPLFELFHLPLQAREGLSIAIGFALVTGLHIVVGELIPKSLAIFSTERYALLTSGALVWFYRLTFPVMLLFNAITNGVMRLLGHGSADEHEVYTDEEIKMLIDESTESGLIDPNQNAYVDNIFDLGDKDAEAIMTPRTELVCLNEDETIAEARHIAHQYKYTRFPVCRDNKDNIIGFVHIKDLYTPEQPMHVRDLEIHPLQAVSEGIPLAKLLQIMQARHTKIAMVVDEHGGTAGIVTMSDIMAQIVGRLDDEYLHEALDNIIDQGQGRYLVDGSVPIDDLVKLLGEKPAPALLCETVGGFIFAAMGRIPQAGDELSLALSDRELICKVLKMDKHRVDKVEFILRPLELGSGVDPDKGEAHD